MIPPSSNLYVALQIPLLHWGSLSNLSQTIDISTKRIGKTSFINRAKQISELIPFKWPDLPRVKFKAMMKNVIGPTFGLWLEWKWNWNWNLNTTYEFAISESLYLIPHLHEHPVLSGGFFPLVGQSNESVYVSVEINPGFSSQPLGQGKSLLSTPPSSNICFTCIYFVFNILRKTNKYYLSIYLSLKFKQCA